jgi:signal transduction histidine kinase
MVEESIRILLIDDAPAYIAYILQAFAHGDSRFQVLVVDSLASARALLETQQPDLMITEWALSDGGALDLLTASAAFPVLPMVVLTNNRNLRSAVAAIKAGAVDYLVKSDIAPTDLPQIARRAIREHRCLVEQLPAGAHQRAQVVEHAEPPIAPNGEVCQVMGSFSAITERRRMQAALEAERRSLARRVAARTTELRLANAELTRAARLKDEFFASMSHELRTPLNTILGMSESMLEQIYGPLTDEQAAALQSVEASGRHLLALINDILDLSTIEAGRLVLHSGPVAIEDIIQSSLRMIKQPAHQKRLSVALNRDSSVVTISADPRRLKQMLVNLLNNAVKFTPDGGAIGLEIAGDMQQGVVRLTVWDTGIGIAFEDLEQLFRPFIQLDSRLSRQYMGTGLGLVLVARMAKLHGGSVAAESTLGQGSRFTIVLPWPISNATGTAPPDAREADDVQFQRAQIGADLPRDTNQQPVGRRMILIADDNADNTSMFSRYLRMRGYDVVVALNGAEVLQLARELRPDLILMDIQMPEIDGLEATRRIRADAALASIPIIALTALVMAGDRDRCLAAGMNAYLSKPIGLQQLVAEIQTQLGDRHIPTVPAR